MYTEQFIKMWEEIKELFERKFREYDAQWIERERKINTRFLVLFILRLVIPKDDRGYSNTLLEIFNNFLRSGITEQPNTLAASSVCEARMKLDPEIFRELSFEIIEIWNRYNDNPPLWEGLKVYTTDGSKITLSRELLEFGFQKDGEHCFYPQGLLSSMYDVLTGMPYDYSFVTHGDERACALDHLKHTKEQALHMYDRGYFSFELLLAHSELKKEVIFRLQRNVHIQAIDDFWNEDATDKEVWISPTERFKNKSKQKGLEVHSEAIKVRLVKYVIEDKTAVLLTTLINREKYPLKSLQKLYHFRWAHEEMLKVSKVITGVTDIHSKTERGVKQEIFAHFLIIVLLKIVEWQAKPQKEKELKEKKPPLRALRGLNGKGKAPKKNRTADVQDDWPYLRNGIQINQKAIFLLLSWTVEKILYLGSTIEETISYLVTSAQKVYSVFRPNRSHPRKSRTAPSKFYRAKNA